MNGTRPQPVFAPRRLASDGPPPANGNVRRAGAGRAREACALIVWTASLFLFLALASYLGDPVDAQVTGAKWVGPVGEACARAIVGMIGVAAWSVPVELALLGVPLVRGRRSEATPARLAGDLLIVVVVAALVQVAGPGGLAFGKHVASGMVGELFGELARSLFSTAGSFLVGFASLGLVLIARASFSFIALVRMIVAIATRVAGWLSSGARNVTAAWRTARALEREQAAERAAARAADMPHIELTPAVTGAAGLAVVAEVDADGRPPEAARPRRRGARGVEEELGVAVLRGDGQSILDASADNALEANAPPLPAAPRRRRSRAKTRDVTGALDSTDVGDTGAPHDGATERSPRSRATLDREEIREREAARDRETADDDASEDEHEASESGDDDGMSDGAPVVATERTLSAPSRAPRMSTAAPTIVDTSAALAQELPARARRTVPVPSPIEAAEPSERPERKFVLPALDFLVPAKVDPNLAIDRDALYRNAEVLVKTLGDYGVSGKVEDILPGPTVTTYEVSPAAGTKVSKVASLADDLALALAKKVRIVAPIPGKNRIGFELPNERRVPVNLRDLVEDRRFQSLDVPLPVVMGRDIVGNPVYADLASMPHVIVAGATGAGKSVGLNVMLASLLYRRTPEELRLLMIDPKVVELAPFDRIPHMLLPVVTDMKQAATALKWAVNEMERRYQLFADAGTKNITTYNGWVPRAPAKKDPKPEKLPFIVVVVDEFADLMMQQGKDVEVCVARLAQKARAAGMHVILATQRPSVDVITGMIKANFPTRIAFRVAQKVDSRTILDEQGAEHLLGSGDMLVKLNGTNETKRVQCPWVSEGEVQLVTDHLRTQGEPVYDENILKPTDDEEAEAEEDGELDAMYDDAVRIVAETRRCSTSWLQRKLQLGYNRAARIVETMERRGLVGPANGAKDREVLIEPI